MAPGPHIGLILGGSWVFSPLIRVVRGWRWENGAAAEGCVDLEGPAPRGISWRCFAASGWIWASPSQQGIPSLPAL